MKSNYKVPEGKVLILRTSDKDGKSRNNFQWPESGEVKCPDWDPKQECGNGLHGLLWGRGDYGLLASQGDARWIIAEVDKSDIVDLGQNVKFPQANVIYSGSSAGALGVLKGANWGMTEATKSSTTGDDAHSSTTGNRAHSSTTGYAAHSSTTGNRAHSSTTGNRAHSSTTGYAAHSSTTGNRAHSSTTGYAAHSSTTGNRAHSSTTGYAAHSSTTGNRAHSSTTGNRAHSSTTGDDACAVCLGYSGRVKAEHGPLVAAWWDDQADRRRVAVAYPGEDGIEAGVWYRIEKGEFIKAED